MIFIGRSCFLTRSFYSLHQSTTFINRSNTLPKKCNLIRVSSSSTLKTGTDGECEFKSTTADSDEDRMLKIIELEISLLRDYGGRAPDVNLIKKHHWDELLSLKTKTARRRYYSHLFLIEKTKEYQAMKKQQRTEARLHQLTLDQPTSHIAYGLGRTSFLLRMDDKVTNLWRNNRLVRAMQFGEKLIFDCSYDEHMTKREEKNAAKQLTHSFAYNRKNKDPFDLHFCNVNFNSETMKQMERHIPVMRNKEFPMNLYEGSYLDLFPRNQLVYLTPHCDTDLQGYDPDMIYIIGAMVDKMNHEPLSLAKAKKLNLKMARLPHCEWGSGASKLLTLDQMINIMLDLKKTRDWQVALKHVPRRKLAQGQNNKQMFEMKTFFNQTKKFS